MEIDFKYITRYAYSVLKDKGITFLKPQEVINDAYLYAVDNNLELSNDGLKSAIRRVIREKVREKHYSPTTNIYSKQINDSSEEKMCTHCKEFKNIVFFGITQVYRYGGSYRNSRCKDCSIEITTKWNKSNPEKRKIIYKKAKSKRRQELSDSYILEVLRRDFKNKDDKFLKSLIQDRRRQILLHRAKKKNQPKIDI